jgi:hypothetical protein
MAHSISHQCGTSPREYFTEQFLTICVVGVYGLVGVLMYRNGQLGYILALPFHLPVLIGGFAVLALVILRAIGIWYEAGKPDVAHHRPPESDPEADGHDHDLAWVFTRVLVLTFPVGLFLIGSPNAAFSEERIRMLVGGDDALMGDMAKIAYRNGTVGTFEDLRDAAGDEGKREKMVGQTAILEGRIRRINDRQFTLFRVRMTCCAEDIVSLKVRIVLKNGTLSGFDDFTWVQMIGQVQFVQAPNSEQYIPVIVIEDVRDIQKIKPRGVYD